MSYDLINGNSFEVLEEEFPDDYFHAVVTDPPYGVIEFAEENVEKMRDGVGGVWRIPPSLDGNERKPLPRFTVLDEGDLEMLQKFFHKLGDVLYDKLRPGGHVFIASTQLLMHYVSNGFDDAGLERRDVLVRETKTLRGGDRPKGAHDHPEYRDVSSMPRVYWEPWLLYRKPLEGKLTENLEEWQTGGLRRESDDRPFTDLLEDGKTPKEETEIVRDSHPAVDDEEKEAHPNLKPQYLMRELCHAALPLQEGTILDPFMGSGSTIAAAHALGYDAVGIELDDTFYQMAENAIHLLADVDTPVEERPDFAHIDKDSASLADFS
jgi:site-specific DNA-methyltransferase (adenine-specific)